MKNRLMTVALAGAALSCAAQADIVTVEIAGEIEWNAVGFGRFANVSVGDKSLITFSVDSDIFVNSSVAPYRGYEIDQSSFVLSVGSESFRLESPFPAGFTPYFVIRNDDPRVDGFFFGRSENSPGGLPLDEIGKLGPFESKFEVTYGESTLSSLNILDALGTYEYGGLTVFNLTIDDGPAQPIGLLFERLVLSSESTCYADCDTSTGAGVLDVFDFLCFQDSFVGGGTYACDCDTSTGIGVCDVFDFLCFQDAFVNGCP